jgi:hypothetical protein
MSTRATYLVNGQAFYIHYDGYPAGAAHYFASMLSLENTRGGWPCMFLRANDQAEFTSGHDDHGDTDFRYDLDEKERTVEALRVADSRSFDNRQFVPLGKFDILEFIRKYAEWDATPREFVTICGRYVPKERGLAWIEDRLAYAQSAYFMGWTGNSSGALDEVKRHDVLLTPNQRRIVQALDAVLKARFAA